MTLLNTAPVPVGPAAPLARGSLAQGAAIQLAAREPWQLGHTDDHRRHERRRELRAHALAQGRVRRQRGAGDVGNQARGLAARDDGHIGHAGRATEDRLHGLRLHADAADLHLLVEAPDELQRAAVASAGQVAGAKPARAPRRIVDRPKLDELRATADLGRT